MNILQEADALIHADREQEYGKPSVNIKAIADLWSVYLKKKVTPRDVCLMMTLVKIGREVTGQGKRDNLVDAAGYIGLIERTEET